MTTKNQITSPADHHGGESLRWQDRLDHACDSDEIVAIAREFLARISSGEFSRLPTDCRPRKIVDADDVVDFALTLMSRSCARDSMSDTVLHEIASFFTDACNRLSELGRAAPDAPATTQ